MPQRRGTLAPLAGARIWGGSYRVVGEWATCRRRAETASNKQLQKILSAGNIARHWQPVEAIYRIASTTDRRFGFLGRPNFEAVGRKGAINVHSASVRSLA